MDGLAQQMLHVHQPVICRHQLAAGEEDRKFLSAMPGHKTRLIGARRNQPRKILQHNISGLMAMGVVQRLEMVEVGHRHAERLAGAGGVLDGFFQRLVKGAAVGNGSQRIAQALRAHLVQLLAQRRDQALRPGKPLVQFQRHRAHPPVFLDQPGNQRVQPLRRSGRLGQILLQRRQRVGKGRILLQARADHRQHFLNLVANGLAQVMGCKHALIFSQISLEQQFDIIGRDGILPQQQLVNLRHKCRVRLRRIGKPHRIGIGEGRSLVFLAQLKHPNGGLARFPEIQLRSGVRDRDQRGSVDQLRAHVGSIQSW